ncbi:MAG: relaxase domain-containing protein [Selenomonadaceae bacterium]|nr:relaxase domain-containing protein [Selenomonadaceae bacterium]
MLSVSACSSKMAGTYFTDAEENYYTRDSSALDEWQGSLCKKIGVADGSTVRAADFQTILAARETKCAAYDCTFSAPKSVSIVSQIGTDEARRDMLEAHREAVQETLQDMEQNAIFARTKKGGVITRHQTGNAAIAKFEHNLSRNCDPQLHTHAVFMNNTELNGKLYAIDGSELYKRQKTYGAEYRARLASKLRARGYEIIMTDNEKGFFELKGMEGKRDLEIFSTRRTEILAAMKAQGVSGAEAAQSVTLATRNAKQHDIDENALREEWRETWGDRPLAEKSAEPLPVIDKRAAEKMAFDSAVKALEEKNYAWTDKKFEEELTQRGVSCGMTRERAQELIASDQTLIRCTLENPENGEAFSYYTTQNNYDTEKELFEMTADGRGRFGAALDHKTAEATRAEVCRENGWTLTDQQKNLVSHIAESEDNIIGVRGLAGVGKSFSLNAAREVLEKQGYEVMGAAPSGQAALELAVDAKMEGTTADGLTRCATLQKIMNEAERSAGHAIPGENYETKRTWNFDNIKAPTSPRVYFIDEAGMVDNNTLREFLKMTEAQRAAGAEVKVVLVGDDKQLPPVGAGNFFSDAVQQKLIETAELTDIRRQKDSPELLKAVREAVQGDAGKALDILSDDVREIKTTRGRVGAIKKEYMSMTPAQREETLILTATNADRVRINDAIRAELIKTGEIEQGKGFSVITTNEKNAEPVQRFFSSGDKMIFLKTDLKMGVRNGTKGTIESIEGNTFRVNIGDGKTVSFDVTKYDRIDHAYAVTTYKSQGATVDRVLINMNSKDETLNCRNSFYVNISRARNKVSLFCDNKEECGKQIQDFAKKYTSKDFVFNSSAGTFSRARTAPKIKAAPVGGAGKAMDAVSAIIPPIPVVKPLLSAIMKAAKVAVKAGQMAARTAKSTASMAAQAGAADKMGSVGGFVNTGGHDKFPTDWRYMTESQKSQYLLDQELKAGNMSETGTSSFMKGYTPKFSPPKG